VGYKRVADQRFGEGTKTFWKEKTQHSIFFEIGGNERGNERNRGEKDRMGEGFSLPGEDGGEKKGGNRIESLEKKKSRAS